MKTGIRQFALEADQIAAQMLDVTVDASLSAARHYEAFLRRREAARQEAQARFETPATVRQLGMVLRAIAQR